MVFSHFFAAMTEAHLALPVMYKEMKELFATLNSQRQLNARYHYQWIVFFFQRRRQSFNKTLKSFLQPCAKFPRNDFINSSSVSRMVPLTLFLSNYWDGHLMFLKYIV